MKWLKNLVGRGFFVHEVIPTHYSFLVKILSVKLKKRSTSAEV